MTNAVHSIERTCARRSRRSKTSIGLREPWIVPRAHPARALDCGGTLCGVRHLLHPALLRSFRLVAALGDPGIGGVLVPSRYSTCARCAQVDQTAMSDDAEQHDDDRGMEIGRKRRWPGLVSWTLGFLGVATLLGWLLGRFTNSAVLATVLVGFIASYMLLMGYLASRHKRS